MWVLKSWDDLSVGTLTLSHANSEMALPGFMLAIDNYIKEVVYGPEFS